MELKLLHICIIALNLANLSHSLRFAHSYGNHMVLQRAPHRAQLYGYADTVADTITVLKDGVSLGQTHVHQNTFNGSNGYWEFILPSESNPGPFNITVTSSEGSVTIKDVLFGDVWICSGQSNMQFTMLRVNNSHEEILDSLNYPDVRMLMSTLMSSPTPMEDSNILKTWRKPTKGVIDTFSALCFFFGRNLQRHLKYPIGLIETSYGGTKIEHWSSPDALAACPAGNTGKRAVRPRPTNSGLWNAMMFPFLKLAIKGAIWYQGESNTGDPDHYACEFPAMISDWRHKFYSQSRGGTSKDFPFGFVQLAANQNATHIGLFPALRWAQTANLGNVPNPKIPNTFMAVALDLPDFLSPYGSIHSRYKQGVAERLTLGARAVAYGEQDVVFQGPFPSGYALDKHHTLLTIHFDKGTMFHNTTGFEICCDRSPSSLCTSKDVWAYATVHAHTQSSVTLTATCAAGHHAAGIRYLWHTSPCKTKMCPLYSTVNDLPAPPFIKTGGFSSGTGIIG